MKNKIKSLIFLLLLSLSTVYYQYSSADNVDCDKLDGDAKDQCEALEKKAKVYKDLIELKNKQQDTLATQMQFIDQEQEKNHQDLASIQTQVVSLQQEIDTLDRAIKEKESMIETQKKILKSIMQSYYEYDQQGMLDIVLLDSDLNDLSTQSDYLEQSGMKVRDVLSNINKAKQDILTDYNELKSKQEQAQQAKENLEDKKYSLQASENQKQSLMSQTQGEEEKYRQLLSRVEAQKKDLFNFSEASNLGEINNSVGSYAKPTSNLASTSWYFSQKDSRWGNQRIGNSSSLMKDYGCAVTCVSMVFRKLGSSIDPGKMAKQKIFYYDLIKWPGSWDPGIDLVSSINHGNIDWKKIDSEIKDGNPVIVYIGKTNGKGGHYVVITGKDKKDYIVHDPYFGPNLYLSTSRSLVGKIGADSGTKVDQMIIYSN